VDAPSEVEPLIEEVNSLLDQQDESMVRARDRAADLAHGLKTPLTALAKDIARLRAIGADDIANDIEELSLRMRRHLDRELARARDRHGRAHARTAAKIAIDSIIRTLAKTPNGENLQFQNLVPGWVELAVDQGDFLEVAGNLLENACKYAVETISVECGVRDGWASIIVNDDGPGVLVSRITHITQRGVRLDTAESGSGLGLAIVKDILEANGGEISLQNRTGCGLSAPATFRVAPPLKAKDRK
jgi:signal transduction histidine kinase